jgi:hypothetical protein
MVNSSGTAKAPAEQEPQQPAAELNFASAGVNILVAHTVAAAAVAAKLRS